MYAIIDLGGRQHKVTAGDTLLVDQKVEEGTATITFDRVLLVAGAGDAKVGDPVVTGATVTADVVGAEKGDRVWNVKYNRRKGYRRRVGHRQQYTRVTITAINA